MKYVCMNKVLHIFFNLLYIDKHTKTTFNKNLRVFLAYIPLYNKYIDISNRNTHTH